MVVVVNGCCVAMIVAFFMSVRTWLYGACGSTFTYSLSLFWEEMYGDLLGYNDENEMLNYL